MVELEHILKFGLMSDENCHSDDVTSLFIDYADNPVGSVLNIDGKCYIKTGIQKYAEHFLSNTPPVSAESCSECENPGSS